MFSLTPVLVLNLLHLYAECWPQSHPKRSKASGRKSPPRHRTHLWKLAITKPLYPSHAGHCLALGGGFPGHHHGRPPGESFDFSPHKVAYSKLLIILEEEPTGRIVVTKAGEPWPRTKKKKKKRLAIKCDVLRLRNSSVVYKKGPRKNKCFYGFFFNF